MNSLLLIVGAIALLVAVAVTSTAWFTIQTYRQLTRQVDTELSNLNNLGRQLLRSQLDIDALCELIYWQAGQIVPTSLFQLGLFDSDSYRVKVWVRDNQRLPEATFAGGAHRGIVGWVKETGQAIVIRDYQSERDTLPAFPDFDLPDPPRSGIFVPLIAGNSTIGVIAIQSRQSGHFENEHLRRLTALANQVAWAIRNAQLYESIQQRAEHLELIRSVSTQISTVQPLPALFKQIVQLTKSTFGYYCVSIFVSKSNHLQIGASTSEHFQNNIAPIRPGSGLIGWSGRKAQTALANNVAQDKRYRRVGLLPETQSEIAIPLIIKTRVVGVLDVQSNSTDAFQPDDVFVLETLAAQIAVAIEQAQTYADEHRLAQRLEALMQVSQAVVSLLDLDELLERVVDLIADTFGFRRVHIFQIVGDQIIFRAGTGPHSIRWMVNALTYQLDDRGLIPKTVRTGKSQFVADVSKSKDFIAGPGIENTRSEMVIPIKMASRMLGIIDLQSDEKNAFSEEDLVLMQSLADTVAVAIRNATLYANERRRRNLADTLREVSASLASNLNLDEVLARILDGLSQVVSLDSIAILLVEEDREESLRIVATTGNRLNGIVGNQLHIARSSTANPLATQEEAISTAYHELLQVDDKHICVIAPLLISGNRIGYLIADNHDAISFSPSDREIVLAFANQAAVAINNARLYSAQQSEAWVTTALLQVAEAVNGQVSIEEILETIARLATLLSGVDQCLILRWLPSEQSFLIEAFYPTSRNTIGHTKFKAADYPFLDLLSVATQPLRAGNNHQLPMPDMLEHLLRVPSALGFPLHAKGDLVGVMIVDDRSLDTDSDGRLLDILTGIAHQTATALETALLHAGAAEHERLDQELEVARRIQASFIPESPPNVPGWSLAAHWRAARQVSGDFYDFIPLPNNLWGLVIADVADKGVPAALFMAMCRTLVRATAMSRSSPADTLVRVNDLLHNDSRSDLFVTMLYLIWDPEASSLKYANAGHNPLLLARHGKQRIEELKTHGIALGIIPNIQLEEMTIKINPGDTLLAYTDGVTEARNTSDDEWGTGGLQKAFIADRQKRPDILIANILQQLDTFASGATQHDDITLWALKRNLKQKEF
jgi:serine phosphatase RsbU (regulator of sigma subunit)/putative methionine-R-sulfoxide reductase with GAF domain